MQEAAAAAEQEAAQAPSLVQAPDVQAEQLKKELRMLVDEELLSVGGLSVMAEEVEVWVSHLELDWCVEQPQQQQTPQPQQNQPQPSRQQQHPQHPLYQQHHQQQHQQQKQQEPQQPQHPHLQHPHLQ